jgi:uncharacterized protein (DUF983 family)
MAGEFIPSLGSLLRQRCPRCGEGRLFEKGLTLLEHCPVCGLRFVREPGFFLGAMIASYALAIPILLGLTLAVHFLLVPDWPLHWVLFLALVPFLPLALAIVRYSRVVYIYFEQWVNPRP